MPNNYPNLSYKVMTNEVWILLIGGSEDDVKYYESLMSHEIMS